MHEWDREDNSYMMSRSYGEMNKHHDRLNLVVRLVSLAVLAVMVLSIVIFQSLENKVIDTSTSAVSESVVTEETAESTGE